MRCSLSACAAISLCLFLGSTPLALGAGPEGSWHCIREASPIGTLGIRPTSYVLIQPGKVVPGTYSMNNTNMTIESGPLKDMGMTSGVLDETTSPRTIGFTSDGGAMTCREVL